MGCNGWGQASMSGCSYLIPALLGERKLEEDEHDLVEFLHIKRFMTKGWNKPKF